MSEFDLPPSDNPFDGLTPEEIDALGVASRRIAIELARGNTQLAHKLVDDSARALYSIRGFDTPLVDTPLAAVGFDARILAVLEDGLGATTIGDLLDLRVEQITARPMVGAIMAIKILSSLQDS